ncbi:MAG: radical SAM protein [Thermodesulfobacteriota bacterium]
MPPKVLLINPWIYDFSAYDCWNKPIGLLYLASLLRMNGSDVFFVDCLDPGDEILPAGDPCAPPKRKSTGDGAYPRQIIGKPSPLRGIPRHYRRYGIAPERFISRIQSMPRPDMVMMTSMMTYWYPAVFETVRLVHAVLPGVPIALGGNYVTLCPEHAALSGAEFTVTGPAEETVPSLLKSLFRHEMDVLPDRDRLDSYPYPAFDLIPNPKQIPIMASRGCPYRCTYCASHMTSDAYLRRDPVRVADEIEHWHRRLGVAHFAFYDDALLVDPDSMALPLLRELIRRDMPIQFHCPNGLHLREVTAELANLMFRAGFRTIRFGFETSNDLRQRSTGGKADNRTLREAVGHLKGAGYGSGSIGVYLLCGLPGQSAEEVMESIRFVRSCGARPVIAEYSPIPGTGLWKEAME